MRVDFRLLGAVEVRVDGRTVALGHARQLSVLSILLVSAGRVVSADQLIDRVWGDEPPHTAHTTLYGYLHRLRRVLTHVPDAAIERRAGGYVLEVDPTAVDLHRFRHLVSAARSASAEDSLAALDKALGLWRGEAFAGLGTPWLDAQRRGLDQDRFTAELDRADAALRLGRHAELVSGLTALAEDHPLDERLAGQLMRTLHHAGRQADALGVFADIRRRLLEELGMDPGRELLELHQEILSVDEPAPPRPSRIPRQLPARPWLFSGRANDLALLDKLLAVDSPTPIAAITGAGGIGKTCLALTWAHRNADRFPDGQLYVDLRGFAAAGEPVRPHAALRVLLDGLGIDPVGIPADQDAQAALYRSVVADRRMLLVLDDARDTAQVEPLLPGGPNCTVVITSRHRMVGLAATRGAGTVTLDVLAETESRDVLAGHLGQDRVAAEPDAVAWLLVACAGLPLALGVVCARAAAHPDFPLGMLADELRDTATRLDALDTGELSADLRAVHTASHRVLPSDTAALFTLLGHVPVPDIGEPAAAAVAGRTGRPVRVLLRELERAHLVRQHLPGRYTMHDLTRLYAAECADEAEGDAALRRLADFYLHTAFHADHLVNPAHEAMDPAPLAGTTPVDPPADRASALAWLDAELPGVLAVQEAVATRGWHLYAWQLAWTIDGYLWRGGYLLHHVAAWRIGLDAARRTGEMTVQTRACRRLGHSYARSGQHAAALEHLAAALAAAEQIGDLVEQARGHDVLAWTLAKQGDHRLALRHARRTLECFRTAGATERIANSLNTIGWYHAQLGEYEPARDHCEQALAMHRERDDRDGEGCTLDSLGFIASRADRPVDAAAHYRAALAVLRGVGNRYEEANTLVNLGDAHEAVGEHAEARAARRQALELYRAQHRTRDVARVQRLLAD